MKTSRRLLRTFPLAMGMMMVAGNSFAATTPLPNEVSINQQANKVTGVVLDSNGEPIIGASVVVKGTTNGAITDIDGNFSLTGVKRGAVIQISFVGYITQEVTWNGQALSVKLKDDSKMLDEVVVVGYGVVRKADLAGSVAVMDNKAFKDQPITKVSDALQGRMAGVNVVSSGVPGGSVRVRVRGSNSINKSNEPLYVVDGIVRESGLDGINPEDIQSMQVLKDASSTAIYGSRGANGVVIITTKTGKSGQTNITFDASVGVSNATRLPELMGTKEYADFLVNYGGKSAGELADYANGNKAGIDWADQIFRTGLTQNYKLVFTKGTDAMSTYISGNYMSEKGLLEGSDFTRYALKSNVKAKMTDWLDVTLDLNASRGIGKGTSGLAYGTENPIWVAFNSSPTMDMYDADGYFVKDPYGTIQYNAYGQLVGNQSERRNDVLNGRIDLQFNIAKGLTFTSTNGFDYLNYTWYNFSPRAYTAGTKNSMGNNNRQRLMLQSTNNLTYVGNWGKHNLTATGVWEITTSEKREMGISGENLLSEIVGWWDVKNAKNRDSSNAYEDWALLSGVGRVMYNYDNRYMLTGTFRADGSSRFTNHKWGYFPSIAAAWTISNEKFMESTRDVVNNLKLRASYGIIGNQDITPYSTLGLLSPTTTYYGDGTPVTGYYPKELPTADLKWEKTNQFDFGVDASFLEGRFDLSLDYFHKKTTDALLWVNIPGYLGGGSVLQNVGEVKNSGFDASLTANILRNNDWTWSSTINGTYLKNEVVKLTALQPEILSGNLASTVYDATIVKAGEPLGSFYGYRWAGIDSEGFDTYYAADGSVTRKPGANDRTVIGKSTPDFTLGWNNTITYKNWSLNAFFNGAFGVQRMNVLRYAMNTMTGNARMITDATYFDEMGKTMPKLGLKDNQALSTSSKWVENANYFRCENITLSYDLPKKTTQFADLRLSLSVQNLFTLTSYKGSNPSGYSFAEEGDRISGVDMGTYPTPRTFTFGVRMNF